MTADQIVADFDSGLMPSERAAIDTARRFGREQVAPQVAQWEREHRFPLETLQAACQAGLAGIELPPEQGGLGLRFSAKLRIAEELAAHDFGFAFSLINHHNALGRIATAAPAVAQRLLPAMLAGELVGCSAYTEPGHGSDLSGLRTTAKRVAGGWQISGEKAWICNAAAADVAIVLAQTEPGSGSRGIAAFVLEAEPAGFKRLPAYDLPGAQAIGAGGLQFDQHFAPDDALLAPPGTAFKRALAGINGARAYVAAMCAGLLDAALTQAVRRASERTAFGQSVIEFQGLRWSLVDVETDLAALRLLTYRAAHEIEQGGTAEQAAARAKKFAGERTLGHVAACLQAMGAAGLRGEYPLLRHLTAAKIACFTDGTTEMLNERLGKLLMRLRSGGNPQETRG